MLTRINIAPTNTTTLSTGIVILGIAPRNRGQVVFIAETGSEGTVGFALNRKPSHLLRELVPEVPYSCELPVYIGGTAKLDTLHMLHDDRFGGTQVGPIRWGGTYNELLTHIKEGDYDELRIKLLAGYTGWDSLELENEIAAGQWICMEAPAKVILSARDPFKYLLRRTGLYGSIVMNQPEIPEYN